MAPTLHNYPKIIARNVDAHSLAQLEAHRLELEIMNKHSAGLVKRYTTDGRFDVANQHSSYIDQIQTKLKHVDNLIMNNNGLAGHSGPMMLVQQWPSAPRPYYGPAYDAIRAQPQMSAGYDPRYTITFSEPGTPQEDPLRIRAPTPFQGGDASPRALWGPY